jgi:hypothetical protein
MLNSEEYVNPVDKNEEDSEIYRDRNIGEMIADFITNHPYITAIIVTCLIAALFYTFSSSAPSAPSIVNNDAIAEILDVDVTEIPMILAREELENHLGMDFLIDYLYGDIPLGEIVESMYNTCLVLQGQIVRDEIAMPAVIEFLRELELRLDILEKAHLINGSQVIQLIEKIAELYNLIG